MRLIMARAHAVLALLAAITTKTIVLGSPVALAGHPAALNERDISGLIDKRQVGSRYTQTYRGYSTWTLQAYTASFTGHTDTDIISEDFVHTQADALTSSQLSAFYQSTGTEPPSNVSLPPNLGPTFTTFNLDSGWQADRPDSNGRPVINSTFFPSGIDDLRSYLNGKGLGMGLYYVPGVSWTAVQAKSAVLGTDYTVDQIIADPGKGEDDSSRRWANAFNIGASMNYSHPGSQAYIDSIVSQLYDWNVTSIKLDGCYPGSSINSTQFQQSHGLDTRPDEKAWRDAIERLKPDGRDMQLWFTTSWERPNDIESHLRDTADSWRITIDVETYSNETLTTFSRVMRNGCKLAEWTVGAKYTEGGQPGWLDMDSLVITGPGLSDLEIQSEATLWFLSGGPIILGGNLTTLTDTQSSSVSNPETLAIQHRSGTYGPARLLGFQNGTLTCNDMDEQLSPSSFSPSDEGFENLGRIASVREDWGPLMGLGQWLDGLLGGLESVLNPREMQERSNNNRQGRQHSPEFELATLATKVNATLPDWFAHQVWHFEEPDGTVVVGVINLGKNETNGGTGDGSADITFKISQLLADSPTSPTPNPAPTSYNVRDLWAQTDGSQVGPEDDYSTSVDLHGSKLLQFSPS